MKFIEKVAEKYGLEKTELQKDYAQYLAKEHNLTEKQTEALAATDLGQMDKQLKEAIDPGWLGREVAQRNQIPKPKQTYFKGDSETYFKN